MTELLFGSIAVREGFIDARRLASCLAEQKASGRGRRIGEIMMSRGFLTEKQIGIILDIQRVLLADRAENPPAGLFGQIAVNAGFCTAEALNACLRKQGELTAKGRKTRIGQILVADRRLTSEQFFEVLHRQDRYPLKCSGCSTWYVVEGLGQGTKFFCHACLRSMPIPVLAASGERAREFVEHEAHGGEHTKARGETAEWFGPFVIDSQISRTRTSVQFRAVHRPSGQTVSLTFLRAVQPPSPSDIASFRRAAARPAKLENPAIARLIDVGEVESHPYFATEYLEGRTFASVLEEGKAHRIDLLRFLEKIARAVAYAHGRGVVHGDLKPAALLVGPRFDPRILDFGLAPIVASRPFLKSNPPSPSAYAAPESERAAPDARGDVYALGVMLYEVLSGRLLHLGRTSAELKELIQAGYSRSLPPGVPSEWRTICAYATAISPRERYRDAGELADQMRRALEDKPLAPRRRRIWPFR